MDSFEIRSEGTGVSQTPAQLLFPVAEEQDDHCLPIRSEDFDLYD